MGGTRGRHPWWTPVRVMLALTAVCFALGMVKAQLLPDNWGDATARYTHMCYSDLPYLYTGRGLRRAELAVHRRPAVRARFATMEYPVGIAYWAWWAAYVTHWLSGLAGHRARYGMDRRHAVRRNPTSSAEIWMFVAVNAVGFALLALLATWLLAGVHPGRPWDAASFALVTRARC